MEMGEGADPRKPTERHKAQFSFSSLARDVRLHRSETPPSPPKDTLGTTSTQIRPRLTGFPPLDSHVGSQGGLDKAQCRVMERRKSDLFLQLVQTGSWLGGGGGRVLLLPKGCYAPQHHQVAPRSQPLLGSPLQGLPRQHMILKEEEEA